MTTSRMDAAREQLSGDYWQTLADVRQRLQMAPGGPAVHWSTGITRNVLNQLVAAGIAVRETRRGRVTTRVPGVMADRVVQHWRLRGGGGRPDGS